MHVHASHGQVWPSVAARCTHPFTTAEKSSRHISCCPQRPSTHFSGRHPAVTKLHPVKQPCLPHPAHRGGLQDVVDGGPFCRVLLQDARHQRAQLRGVAGRQRRHHTRQHLRRLDECKTDASSRPCLKIVVDMLVIWPLICKRACGLTFWRVSSSVGARNNGLRVHSSCRMQPSAQMSAGGGFGAPSLQCQQGQDVGRSSNCVVQHYMCIRMPMHCSSGVQGKPSVHCCSQQLAPAEYEFHCCSQQLAPAEYE